MRLSRRIAARSTEGEKDQGVRESSIERKVTDFAKRNGWIVRKLKWINRNGAPDRLFMKGGVCVFVEFKQSKKKARTNQSQEHEKLRAAGMHVVLVDNKEHGFEIFQ